ncbi:glutamate synthase subunit beta [Sphingosinicella ginsenosidimutans]|uniref:Glutamate synthase subunit beta n=1 Tax=Allosphingosinicella ginsenosidimutans TaxID=1176539 RepID=A0A5C6TQQ3_9SPHN|nr:glutamate synthase subunit beta [Sphingosinicella ginsenosidimutans]TXC62546.1 glutamate synthase subunit beta [Sphingosinicella ginsenosidimutans]
MTNPTGFLDIARHDRAYRPVEERLKHWAEFVEPLPETEVRLQAERCMDCGVPFCHSGCPVNNYIPDWNDLVSRGEWRAALERLHRTNNFPEFTGRVCPAPCEAACTLNIDDNPVTIKTIECEIVDRGFREGWIGPVFSPRGSGKRVAIVGSGPAGLACAQQLARMGHAPTVFEKNDRIGGLLRYGIPDFKMEKALIDRRMIQMEAEGVIFRPGVEVGTAISVDRLMDDYHVLVLAGGAEQPRDLPVEGRDLGGIHFAMDYLVQQNRRVAGLPFAGAPILATGRHVVVIGGGDTGSDCIGTANRQGAASVTQIEIMPRPPEREAKGLVWPYWPVKLRTSSSQEEGAAREFSVKTLRVEGENGQARALICEQDGTPLSLQADLVLLAMGFTGPREDGIVGKTDAQLPRAGYQTSRPGIFACGDMRRGQSLVVWAIREGRECAEAVDRFLAAD